MYNNHSMSELQDTHTPLLRINAIMKEDDTLKISLVASPRTSIAKLKRQIEQEFAQLHSLNVLVSVIEDAKGFVLSNNSSIGEHLRHGQTVYVQVHREKAGSDMNLPNNATDLFMTLRFVCGSVLKKLEALQATLDPLQVVPEVIHLGFWYSNGESVGLLCRLLNKLFTPESLDSYYRQAHDMQNVLLLKLINFWFSEVGNAFAGFPQVGEELLALMYKLSLCNGYVQLLRTHKVMKNIVEVSKDGQLPQQVKRMALMVIRNVTGKGTGMGTKTTSAYIPTVLGDSTVSLSNVEEVLDSLCSTSQDVKRQALDELAQNPKLIAEACVRFDYFSKLTFLFTLKTVKDKPSARVFGVVLREVIANTSKEKAKEIMQKDIIRKVHNFLLESHPDAHPPVLEFYSTISKESAAKGVFNIEQANQFLASPYIDFQKITVDSLSEMSERDKQISAIRFLPSIKDYIRLCLKTESESLAASTLKVISNLTLDEQCRYQINNLKGIEIFVKFLETGQKHGNNELQRTCAKGLMNLSLASREIKAKILSLMPNVLDRFYKGALDAVAGSYIENLLKSAKN